MPRATCQAPAPRPRLSRPCRPSHLLAFGVGFELAHVESGFTRVAMRPPFLLTEPKINVLRRRKEGAVGRAAAAATEGDYFL